MHIPCAVCTLPKAGPSLGSSTALLPLLCPPGLAKSIMGGNNIPGRNFPPKREPFPIPLVLFSVLVVSLKSTFWISPGAACRGQEYPWKIAPRGTTTPILRCLRGTGCLPDLGWSCRGRRHPWDSQGAARGFLEHGSPGSAATKVLMKGFPNSLTRYFNKKKQFPSWF